MPSSNYIRPGMFDDMRCNPTPCSILSNVRGETCQITATRSLALIEHVCALHSGRLNVQLGSSASAGCFGEAQGLHR